MSETMSITRGLAELKLLNKRITDSVTGSDFMAYRVGKILPTGFNSVEEIEKFITSKYQSINDLIKRRVAIKAAIVKSNAETMVEVAGESMTVADAIERKSSYISYMNLVISKLQKDFQNVQRNIERTNAEVKTRQDQLLNALYGKDAKVREDERKATADSFWADNAAVEINPLQILQEIDRLKAEVANFETEIDYILSQSNTITMISIA